MKKIDLRFFRAYRVKLKKPDCKFYIKINIFTFASKLFKALRTCYVSLRFLRELYFTYSTPNLSWVHIYFNEYNPRHIFLSTNYLSYESIKSVSPIIYLIFLVALWAFWRSATSDYHLGEGFDCILYIGVTAGHPLRGVRPTVVTTLSLNILERRLFPFVSKSKVIHNTANLYNLLAHSL